MKYPKPSELAKDLSKLSDLIEEGIALGEASHKRLDEVLSTKKVLFGHVPGDVSDELILSHLEWNGISEIFDKTVDYVHRNRVKKDQWTETQKEKNIYEKYFRLLELDNEFVEKACSDVLLSSARTGLLVNMRKEKRRNMWTEGDLELAHLANKFSIAKEKTKFPEKEGEDVKARTERWKIWARERDVAFRQELFWAVKRSGPSLNVSGHGNYDWKIQDDQGKTCLIRLVVPKDKRVMGKFILVSDEDKDWIVGRMTYFNGCDSIEWKMTSEGPQAKVGTIPRQWFGGPFVVFDYMEDRVLDPA